MMQKKHYLSSQTVLTTVITNLIGKGTEHYGLSLDELAPLVPGLAVAISHFIILGLACIYVPSVDEVILNAAIKRKRKLISKQMKTCSDDRKKELLVELDLLDQQALAACTFQVESVAKDMKKDPSKVE